MPLIAKVLLENDETYRFRTYLNYLVALDIFLKTHFRDNPATFRDIVQSRSFRRIQGGRCRDLENVRRTLRSAWLSEIQLSLPVRQPELVAYANHWAPVQLYYSVFLAIRAFFHASGQVVAQNHSTTLRTLTGEIESRPELFPHPWRSTCIGDSELNNLTYNNLPEGITVKPVSSLLAGERVEFWDSYGLFLKTTRSREIERTIRDWKKANNRKRIRRKERERLVEGLSPTSIFHCFYRLRIRSNYDDAESFLVSLENTDEADRFHSALRRGAYYTLLVLELIISEYVGRNCFSEWVDDFRANDRHRLAANLIRRRRAIRSFFN